MPSLPAERLFVATTPGLEPALDDELQELRVRARRVEGGAEVEGAAGLYRRLNLHLRTASRVLLRVASFRAADGRAAADALTAIRLDAFRASGEPLRLSVSAKGVRSGASSVRAVAERAFGIAAEDEEAGEAGGAEGLSLFLRASGDEWTVSVDTSGALLYLRGYRQEVSRAPLRETLAAGILRLAGYRGDEPLWDPMCGSGTIPIEAALIALRRAPGRDRSFAFEAWPSHDAATFASERAEARSRELAAPPQPIRASDLNAGSLGTARRNARRAGVLTHLVLQRDDITRPAALPPEPAGLLVANPPYGKRVGEPGDVANLYRALGALLRDRLPGWRAAILAPVGPLERALGLEIDDGFEVRNGGIRCRLLLCRPHAI